MASTRHLLGQVEGCGTLFCAGIIVNSGAASAISPSTVPLAHNNDLAVTRTAAGKYSLVISNFAGPQGFAVPSITCGSPGSMLATVATPSYSGDTMTLAITLVSSGAIVDADVFFQIFAF